jgi:hypothetical protein
LLLWEGKAHSQHSTVSWATLIQRSFLPSFPETSFDITFPHEIRVFGHCWLQPVAASGFLHISYCTFLQTLANRWHLESQKPGVQTVLIHLTQVLCTMLGSTRFKRASMKKKVFNHVDYRRSPNQKSDILGPSNYATWETARLTEC